MLLNYAINNLGLLIIMNISEYELYVLIQIFGKSQKILMKRFMQMHICEKGFVCDSMKIHHIFCSFSETHPIRASIVLEKKLTEVGNLA